MRASAKVFAPLLASTALALMAGCKSNDPQRCVDETGKVVDPHFCANLPQAQGTTAGTLSNGGGVYTNGVFVPHVYRYYYGGSGFLGGFVSGGGYAPSAGHSYSVTTGTVRGGFGSSFGGGEGGGE